MDAVKGQNGAAPKQRSTGVQRSEDAEEVFDARLRDLGGSAGDAGLRR